MRRTAGIAGLAPALVLIGLLSAACAGGKHVANTPAAISPAGTPIAAGTPAVAALVSTTQLADGWSAVSTPPADFGASRCDGQPLLVEAGTAAKAAFSRGESGPWGVERIARAAAGGPAAFARLGTVLRGCHRLTTPAQGGGMLVWTPVPLPFPRLADDSLAQRLTATNAPRPLAADLVIFRHGDMIALVAQLAAPPGPDAGTTRSLVQQAEATLLRVLP